MKKYMYDDDISAEGFSNNLQLCNQYSQSQSSLFSMQHSKIYFAIPWPIHVQLSWLTVFPAKDTAY